MFLHMFQLLHQTAIRGRPPTRDQVKIYGKKQKTSYWLQLNTLFSLWMLVMVLDVCGIFRLVRYLIHSIISHDALLIDFCLAAFQYQWPLFDIIYLADYIVCANIFSQWKSEWKEIPQLQGSTLGSAWHLWCNCMRISRGWGHWLLVGSPLPY